MDYGVPDERGDVMRWRDRRIQDVFRQLTPSERSIVKYHRNTLAAGEAGKDEEGRPVTVYSNTIEIPEGPHKGKFVTVPGWFDGAMTEDEDKLWNKWAPEVNQGVWPIYDDPKHADSRAKFIHQIMDLESSF